MNHDVDKKESGATITELVATSDEAGSQFFRDTSNNSAEPEQLVGTGDRQGSDRRSPAF